MTLLRERDGDVGGLWHPRPHPVVFVSSALMEASSFSYAFLLRRKARPIVSSSHQRSFGGGRRRSSSFSGNVKRAFTNIVLQFLDISYDLFLVVFDMFDKFYNEV